MNVLNNIILPLVLLFSSVACTGESGAESSREVASQAEKEAQELQNRFKDTDVKIPLPKGLKFNQTLSEVLEAKPCKLQKQKHSTKNVTYMSCVKFPPGFDYTLKSQFSTKSDVVELIFSKEKLRAVAFTLSSDGHDFDHLFLQLQKKLGNPYYSVNSDQARKFNAGVISTIVSSWGDREKLTILKAQKAPPGNRILISLEHVPLDFNPDEFQ